MSDQTEPPRSSAEIKNDSLSKMDTSLSDSDIEEDAKMQQEIEHSFTFIQAVKSYPVVFSWIMVNFWVCILIGFDSYNQTGGLVISTPTFRKDFGHYYDGSYVLDAGWQSAISGTPIAGFVIGSLVGSYLSDLLGRKFAIIIGVCLIFPFVGMEFAATTMVVFFLGKTFDGFALGIISSSSTTYVAEIAPLALRGFATAGVNFSQSIAPFVCYLMQNTLSEKSNRWAYRGIFVTQMAFSATTLIFLPFMPESPWHLHIKGRDDKALKVLGIFYKHNEETVRRQFAIIKVTIAEANKLNANAASVLELFKGTNLRRTIISVVPFWMQAMSGVAYATAYSTYYYELSGFTTKQSFGIACGAMSLSVVGVLVSFWLVNTFGRRPLILYGMMELTVVNLIIAAAGIKKVHGNEVASSAFFVIYNFVYNISVGPMGYVICADNPTSKLRVKTIGLATAICSAFQCLWSFVLPYIFNPDQGNLGSKTNFIFFAACALSVVYFYICQPETKGRSYEEIDEMYAKKVPARKFKDFVCECSHDKEDKHVTNNSTPEEKV